MTDSEKQTLVFLEAKKVITSSEKNLRSKIESMNRSILNLEEKRSRIEYELKKQKKSLVRKREELKRASKLLKTRGSSVLEACTPILEDAIFNEIEDLQFLDSKLLGESSRRLED